MLLPIIQLNTVRVIELEHAFFKSLDNLSDLCLCGHINKLVSQVNHHTTYYSRVDLDREHMTVT